MEGLRAEQVESLRKMIPVRIRVKLTKAGFDENAVFDVSR